MEESFDETTTYVLKGAKLRTSNLLEFDLNSVAETIPEGAVHSGQLVVRTAHSGEWKLIGYVNAKACREIAGWLVRVSDKLDRMDASD